MIMFTRLNRSAIAINPDLIERVEANPDTVITLTDDKKILVVESMQQVIELINDFRAWVIARSRTLEVVYEPHPALHLVPSETVAGYAPAGGTKGTGGTVIDGARVFAAEEPRVD